MYHFHARCSMHAARSSGGPQHGRNVRHGDIGGDGGDGESGITVVDIDGIDLKHGVTGDDGESGVTVVDIDGIDLKHGVTGSSGWNKMRAGGDTAVHRVIRLLVPGGSPGCSVRRTLSPT